MVWFGRIGHDGLVRYSYFCGKIWKPVVTAIIGRDSTPYSCRDSFITHQLAGSMPLSNVCAWCDTSIPVIQKRYLDPALEENNIFCSYLTNERSKYLDRSALDRDRLKDSDDLNYICGKY